MPPPLRCAFNGLAWEWIDAASVHPIANYESTTYGACLGNELAADCGCQ
jgi:hypothetical protein